MSGIYDDPRMTYYEKVATNINMYAYGVKKRGGTRGLLNLSTIFVVDVKVVLYL